MYLNNTAYGRPPEVNYKPVNYTDGSTSREIEEIDEHMEEERKRYFEGFAYKKPTILDMRARLNNVTHLIDVCRSSLQSTDYDAGKIANVLFFSVILELEEINKELARV